MFPDHFAGRQQKWFLQQEMRKFFLSFVFIFVINIIFLTGNLLQKNLFEFDKKSKCFEAKNGQIYQVHF
jgi:hypothetical protein